MTMLFLFWLSWLLEACCFYCLVYGKSTPVQYQVFTLDGIPRAQVSNLNCSCGTCNNTQASYKNGTLDNVAYGRPVSVSSVEGEHLPCVLTNGMLELCFLTSSESFEDPIPWAEIDLGNVISFKSMYITGYYMDTASQRMLGLTVYGDGEIIKEFPTLLKDLGEILNELRLFLEFSPRTSRYIRFEKNVPSGENYQKYKQLHLCNVEIWVCTPGTYYDNVAGKCVPCNETCPYICDNLHGCRLVKYDLALKKRTFMISGGSGIPAKQVDGVKARLSHTRTDCAIILRPSDDEVVWYSVHLGALVKVYSAEVSPRIDCCAASQLLGFEVLVGISPLLSKQELCGNYTRDLPQFLAPLEVTCSPAVLGQYLYITRKTSLAFCELKVWGHRYYALGLNGDCGDGSSYRACEDSCCICDGGKCKLKLFERCSTDDDCYEDKVCDRFKVCKVPHGQNCTSTEQCMSDGLCALEYCKIRDGRSCSKTENHNLCINTCDIETGVCGRVTETCSRTSVCQPGAICSGGICECNPKVSKQQGNRCTKPGKVTAKCQRNSSCVCLDGKCGCPEGEIPNYEDYSCRGQSGSKCRRDNDCAFASACIGGVCRAWPGFDCLDNKDRACKPGTKCIDGVCRLEVGQNCENSDQKYLCVPGSSCGHSFLCEIDLGKNCSHARDNCSSGICSEADGYICKINASQPCSDNSVCASGTFCNYLGICTVLMDSLCTGDGDCVNGMVCDTDVMGQCRIPAGGNCSDHPDKCVFGARCVQSMCRCSRKADIQTGLCIAHPNELEGACIQTNKGKEGGGGDDCVDPRAHCRNGTCKCRQGSVADPVSLECRSPPGEACDPYLLKCTNGSVCIIGECALDVGSPCVGELSGYCKAGTVCGKDEICRLDLKHSCSEAAALCREDLVCDLTNRCKSPAGTFCRETEDCVAGAQCQEVKGEGEEWALAKCTCLKGVNTTFKKGTCATQGMVGGSCDGGCTQNSECDQDTLVCQCLPGYAVNHETLTCAKGVGSECSDDSDCVHELVCEAKCRIKFGELCDDGNTAFCMEGSECDVDKVCKLKLGESCSGGKAEYCRTGTFCDLMEQCSLGAGDDCTDDGESTCVAGATCEENQCTCIPEVSTTNGTICAPKPGRPGGPCVGGACPGVDHAHCVKGICKCKYPAVMGRALNCRLPGMLELAFDFMLTRLFWGLIIILLVAFVIMGLSYLKSNEESNVKMYMGILCALVFFTTFSLVLSLLKMTLNAAKESLSMLIPILLLWLAVLGLGFFFFRRLRHLKFSIQKRKAAAKRAASEIHNDRHSSDTASTVSSQSSADQEGQSAVRRSSVVSKVTLDIQCDLGDQSIVSDFSDLSSSSGSSHTFKAVTTISPSDIKRADR